MSELNGNVKDVFHIVEKEGQKSTWIKVGVAFVNKDSSLNVYLDSIPLSGKLQVRDRQLKTKGEQL